VALKPPVSAAPPKSADEVAVPQVPSALSGNTTQPDAAPLAQPGHNPGHTRIPLAIGLAAASLVAMVIRRLRRG